jgi:hypothetical protein
MLVVSACLSTFTTLMADGTIMSPSGGVYNTIYFSKYRETGEAMHKM